MVRAYNEIPLFVSVYIHAALFTFLILGSVQQTHIHMTWVSFGAGLAASLTINSIIAMVGKIRMI